MEKIDAYKTMTTWAQICSNEETAENTPFTLVIQNPDKKSCSVAVCASSHDAIMLAEHTMKTLVEILKSSIKDEKKDDVFEIINTTLFDIITKAMIREFPAESLKRALNGLDGLKKMLEGDDEEDDE